MEGHRHRWRVVSLVLLSLPDIERRSDMVEVLLCQGCQMVVSLSGEYHIERRSLRNVQAYKVWVSRGLLHWQELGLFEPEIC